MTFHEFCRRCGNIRSQSWVYVTISRNFNEKTIYEGEFYKMPRMISKHYNISTFYVMDVESETISIRVIRKPETILLMQRHNKLKRCDKWH